ncbi:MAG: porin family protein [Elusimicrobia bacterium]|nr:porin family protein [Elusimicrobiota bacterium]
MPNINSMVLFGKLPSPLLKRGVRGDFFNFISAAALLFFAGAAASAQTPARTEAQAVSLSLDGSLDRYGDSRSAGLRAGAELEFASELKLGGAAFDWNLQAYYAYSRSETAGEIFNVNSLGLDLVKILLSRWRDKELETFKPYLLTGLELSWLTETVEGEVYSSRFLSPVLGAGMELELSGRTSLNLEYRRNLAGGERSLSGLTVGVSYAVLGAEEEEAEEKEKD